MYRHLPAELLNARDSANAYEVKRAPHGFNVWRFRNWVLDPTGYRLVDQVRTRGDAQDAIEERLGLKPSTERQPVCVPAVIRPIEHDEGDWQY